MKLLGLDKTADYATLREWCVTILDFLVAIIPEYSYFVHGMKQVIQKLDKKQSMRYMRALYREMNLMIRELYLPDPLMDQLNQILAEKFKYNLVDVAAAEKDEIQKIIKRGRIRNDREFELVKNQEEAIYDDDSQTEYAEILRGLMGAYECPNG